MKTVNIARLKDQLSAHIRAVERGASFTVTDRDRPVAQLVPVPDADTCELLPATRSFEAARRLPRASTRKRIESLPLLLEERGKR